MNKRIFNLVLCMLYTMFVFSQGVDEVTLVVYGDGENKEEATHMALRSAIEQAYGTFVSANTSILNDELVKDEIITISSGNIQKYEEISYLQLENGKSQVTLKATVSLNKLVQYAQNKGAECEFDGATYGANVTLHDLNIKNTHKALDNLLLQIKNTRDLFDYELNIGTPHIENDESGIFDIPYKINILANNQTIQIIDAIFFTIQALGLSESEVLTFSKMGFRYHERAIFEFFLEQPSSMGYDREKIPFSVTPNASKVKRVNSSGYPKVAPKSVLYFPTSEYSTYKHYENVGLNDKPDIIYEFDEKLEEIIHQDIISKLIVDNNGTLYNVWPATRLNNYKDHNKGVPGAHVRSWASDDGLFCYDGYCFSAGIICGINHYEQWQRSSNYYLVYSHTPKTFKLYSFEGTLKMSMEQLKSISKFSLINADGSSVSTPTQDK